LLARLHELNRHRDPGPGRAIGQDLQHDQAPALAVEEQQRCGEAQRHHYEISCAQKMGAQKQCGDDKKADS
jgi:hypothetical protein